MTRRQKDPLRELTASEKQDLESVSRAHSAPATSVIRAKILLGVASGLSYKNAAQQAGRKSGDAVSTLVSRFNQEGLDALVPRHGGGASVQYGEAEKARILREFEREPDLEQDGTTTWSLTTLQRALRNAEDGLPGISTYTILNVLHEAGYRWQRDRTWSQTGQAIRQRKAGSVVVTDPDTDGKKKLIERAYLWGETMGISVWCEDEAGPYGTVPYLGHGWQPAGEPARFPHEYTRNGTAKLLTLLHPKTGTVHVKGVTNTRNETLHGWLKTTLTSILETLPDATPDIDPQHTHDIWESWVEGLSVKRVLLKQLPPLRLILVMDNLAGHKSIDWLIWCYHNGILPLYTPLGGSWLNMAESIQRILKRRALEGYHPHDVQTIIDRLETVARHWNTDPTPFIWKGKRYQRRDRARARRLHNVGASAAATTRPVQRLHQWLSA